MYLKRGHILLAVGGAIAVISFSMLGYYGLQLVNVVQREGKYTIEPHGSINMRQNISNTQGIGMYVIVFAEFGGQASVMITDHTGKIIVDKNLNPPIIIEPFNAEVPGLYNLTLLNPTNRVLEGAMSFGDWEHVLGRKDLFFCHNYTFYRLSSWNRYCTCNSWCNHYSFRQEPEKEDEAVW